MNNISYKLFQLILLCCATALLMFSSCKKTVSQGPVITGIRNYAAIPNDTALTSLTPTGQWVIIQGYNLKNAVRITFDGVPVSFNYGLFADTCAIVQVPFIIPYNTVSADDLNTIKYTTIDGTTTFNFNIVVPPPAITGISNEMANKGDSVRIYGANFFLINSFSFAGTPVTNYNVSADGTYIGFIAPGSAEGGPVSITTKSGTYTTPFNVEDSINGVLCNFDNVFTYQWWSAGLSNNNPDFAGNRGQYAILNTSGPLNNGDGSWWNGGRGINCNAAQWVPAANLSDPPANWALKFEINVPNPWNGTTIYIVKDFNWTYLARYEPWKSPSGATGAVKTNGWQTVTIPLSSFLTKPNGGLDGTGTAAANLSALLGSAGSGGVNMYIMNDGSARSATGFYAGIDNIRVVKIK